MAHRVQFRMGPVLLLVCVAVLLTLLPRHESAYAEEPAFDAGAAVRATLRQLESEQFFSRRLDDKLSAQWLRSFLDRLDPRRMYFLDQDDADFRRSERELDDAARLGEFPLAIRIREVYRERTAEASSYAERFLQAESSFVPADRFPDRFDSYAANVAELQRTDLVGWRLIAIRRVHGPIVDVVEMHQPDFLKLIWMPDGPLGEDREVILELLHPVTRERMTLTWPRYARF